MMPGCCFSFKWQFFFRAKSSLLRKSVGENGVPRTAPELRREPARLLTHMTHASPTYKKLQWADHTAQRFGFFFFFLSPFKVLTKSRARCPLTPSCRGRGIPRGMSPWLLPSTPHGPGGGRSGGSELWSPSPRRIGGAHGQRGGEHQRGELLEPRWALFPFPPQSPRLTWPSMPALLRSLPGGGPGPTRGVQGIEAPLPLGEPKYPRCGRAGQQQQQQQQQQRWSRRRVPAKAGGHRRGGMRRARQAGARGAWALPAGPRVQAARGDAALVPRWFRAGSAASRLRSALCRPAALAGALQRAGGGGRTRLPQARPLRLLSSLVPAEPRSASAGDAKSGSGRKSEGKKVFYVVPTDGCCFLKFCFLLPPQLYVR